MKLQKNIIKFFIGLALLAALFIPVLNVEAVVDCVTITPATGGSAISTDTYYAGTYTSLTGPIITEIASGEVGVGTIILTAPSGFSFYPGTPKPTVKITLVYGSAGSGNSRMINHVASGTSVTVTSVSSTQIVFTVTYASKSGTYCSLTWQNIKVIPTAGTPLASGNLVVGTSSTSTIAGVTKGSTNFGTLTEVAGALYSITVSPSNPSVAVGGTQTYTAQGYDRYGNPVSATYTWSVTNPTAGSINSGTGLFTAGTVVGSYSGVIKATSGAISGTASVTVVAGSLATITVTPSNPTVVVNGTQTYTAQGYDAYGNPVSATYTWSVTNPTAGSINSGTGLFTAGTVVGSYSGVIKATSGAISGTASVTVVAGSLATITVTPSNPSVVVGGTQTYTAQGYDAYGNAVSTTVTWSVTNATAGSINSSSGLFTAGTVVGSYSGVIKATSGAISGTASVTVVAGSLATITVTPSNPTVVVNGTQTYTAQGYDAYGNPVSMAYTWSVTNPTAGSINSGSGLFTAGTVVGSYSGVIKATSGAISGTASVTVTAGSLATITVTPSNPTVVVNGTQTYTAQGYDAYGNPVSATYMWSVTNPTAGSINSSSGLFTAGTVVGSYSGVIKATSGAISGTASVTVVAYMPTATTNAADSVEETTATLHGAVASDGGEVCRYRFEYGTSPGVYTHTTDWLDSLHTGQTFSADISGLSQGTMYYFVAQVTNSADTGTGSELIFLTKPEAPTNLTATVAGSTQINISWTKGIGANRTKVMRKAGSYPTDYNDNDSTLVYFGIGTNAMDDGLSTETTYYYRAWSEVTAESLQQWSDDYASITATTTGAPTATTNAATLVEETTATLHGAVASDGGEICQYRFEYGTSPGVYTHTTDWLDSLHTGQTFSADISGLSQGTLYYFVAQVTNSADTGTGSELVFLTKPEVPDPFVATTASDSQIDLNWTKGAGALRTMIRRSTSGYPVNRDDGDLVYFDTDSDVPDTDLTADTMYYYRSWSEVTAGSLQQWSDNYNDTAAQTSPPPTTTPPTTTPPTTTPPTTTPPTTTPPTTTPPTTTPPTTTPTNTTHVSVGGVVYPIDKMQVMLPWFALFGFILLVGGAVACKLIMVKFNRR